MSKELQFNISDVPALFREPDSPKDWTLEQEMDYVINEVMGLKQGKDGSYHTEHYSGVHKVDLQSIMLEYGKRLGKHLQMRLANERGNHTTNCNGVLYSKTNRT